MDGLVVFDLRNPTHAYVFPVSERDTREGLALWARWGNSRDESGQAIVRGLVYIPYYDLEEGDADA